MPSGNGRVFLGNLPSDCRVEDIEDFFRKYGKVRNILIKNGKFGFAEFDDDRDADDAVYECNGKDFMGSRITVEHAKGVRRDRESRGGPRYGAPVRTKYRLRVENLSSRVSWQDLKDVLRRGGDVTFAEAHTTRRNEGLVEFASADDLDRVYKKYQGYEMNGRRIELIRDGSRSRSKSRSRSRSRSRRSRSRSRSRRSRSRSSPRGGGKEDRSRSKSRSRSRSRDAGAKKEAKRSKSRSRSRSRRS